MADKWPLRDSFELGALPSAVPCARLHARQMLWEWGLYTLAENTELIVAELTTNPVAAARSLEPISPVRLWLLADSTRVLFLIWDASPQPPVRKDTDLYAETGRDLIGGWRAADGPDVSGPAKRVCPSVVSHF